ncbi:MAG: transpeptidase family protein [Bacteroidia bacterium]|nr:transpeptidase family protein [Bacteroidia bacterium]MCZ2277862.1 transpeptidase family protein [Bacteroidia bacterium]
MKDARRSVFNRVLLVFAGFCIFGILIFWKIFTLQIVEGEIWKEKAEELTIAYQNIEPIRGSIYSDNGSLLSTSLPVFTLYVDYTTHYFLDKSFSSKIDSVSQGLSQLFNDKTASEYRRILIEGKRRGSRYSLLKRNVTYKQLKEVRQLPVFRHGRYKGGLIAEQQSKPQKPFKWLAERTLGYVTREKGERSVGIEAAFDEHLRGVRGIRLVQKIAGGIWKPVRNENEVEPKDGLDVISTINVNLQDVAENSLMYHLKVHNAESGCVVLMEVSTGEIKAIANLVRNSDGSYSENYNIAVGRSTEPGSTFKLPALMAAFEDSRALPSDTVDTEKGIHYWISRKPMRDSHEGGYGRITVQRAFELSSNIGVSKVINKSYSRNPMEFVKRLRSMGVDAPLGLQIKGEGRPFIMDTSSKGWSRFDLPYMSIGYSVRMTPLQLLTFYNAIANNGRMVKPLFVKEIREQGKTVRKFETEVLSEAICSQATIEKAKKLLEGVVESGTAAGSFKNSQYKVAGKTGTARIAQGTMYEADGQKKYQASFIGYFPAESPKYSCVVVFYEPSYQYYASQVAVPVFRELADKIYSTDIELHKEVQKEDLLLASHLPVQQKGRSHQLKMVYDQLNINNPVNLTDESWSVIKTDNGVVKAASLSFASNLVPDVKGMGIRDALLLLEGMGLRVNAEGRGKIISQSLNPGMKITHGSEIILVLN